MKKLFRGFIFVTIFTLAMSALSMGLYLLDISWLSPEFISPTYCSIIAALLALNPKVKKFINGTSV